MIAQCLAWEQRRGSLDFEIDGVVVKVNDVRAAAPARRRRPRAALGDRLEVPADDRRDEAARDPLEPRQVRRPAPVRGARAGPGRRRHDQAGDAAQRGGPRAQGHPARRGGDRAARRRRDPAGARAGAARRRARRTARRSRSPPANCPVCDTPTVKPEDSVFTVCPNRDCPGRRWQLLTSFAGVMDIDGLGEKLVTLFMELGWVRTAGDFYRLTAEQIAEQPGFGEVSAGKLVAAIEASKRAAVRAAAVRARDRGGWLCHRPQPRPAVPHDRRAARRRRPEADRADARRRAEDGGEDPRSARRPADAGADRRAQGTRAALRGGGPAAGRGAARRARRSS